MATKRTYQPSKIEAQAHAWVPGAHGHEERPPGPEAPSGEGPQAPRRHRKTLTSDLRPGVTDCGPDQKLHTAAEFDARAKGARTSCGCLVRHSMYAAMKPAKRGSEWPSASARRECGQPQSLAAPDPRIVPDAPAGDARGGCVRLGAYGGREAPNKAVFESLVRLWKEITATP